MDKVGQTILSWRTLEYPYQEKDSGWFIALFVIAIAGIVGAFLFGQLLFAAIIAIGSFTLAIYGVKRPKELEIVIAERAVVIDLVSYKYKDLESFSVDDNVVPHKLILERRKLWDPLLILPMPTELAADTLRSTLGKRLHEKHFREPLSHRVMEYLGF